ncbi:uncharacterized protein N7484_010174 [Penicillium longicatenatum]|uniref:uncharacterized protein n=1 Tax=Penicillium longicatenatum TaxID=1561947 RepID=UPI0025498C5C|nr:uncharacterized protein N7484_010174 [Penicillium longicatenatum]KAJ5636861.1 hypothetical protein N7484_010174 [Penicillium longicatenatum]
MGLFNNDGKSNHTCPIPKSFAIVADQDILPSMSFYSLNMIISGACTAFVCVAIFILMFWHAIHLSKPREQIKILKICFLIPLYTITSFLSICYPHAFVYLTPWLDLFQAVALGSFFLLLCEFIARDSQANVDVFFVAFQPPQKKGNKAPLTGLEWFRKQWIAIFQYPVVALLTSLATDFTQVAGVYCLDSNKVYFAHLWLTIITSVSIAFAVISVLTFYRTLKSHLASHKPLSKLLAFKLIVGLTFLERIIFTILRSTNVLKSTSTLSYADVNIGIPNLVICLHMVPFSIFFHYAYNVGPYKLTNGIQVSDPSLQESAAGGYQKPTQGSIPRGYEGGPLGVRAWIGLFNPMEIIRAIKFGLGMAQAFRRHDIVTTGSQSEFGPNMSPEHMPSTAYGHGYATYERLLIPNEQGMR